MPLTSVFAIMRSTTGTTIVGSKTIVATAGTRDLFAASQPSNSTRRLP